MSLNWISLNLSPGAVQTMTKEENYNFPTAFGPYINEKVFQTEI